MEHNELLLPQGEEEIQTPSSSHFHLENKINPSRSVQSPPTTLPQENTILESVPPLSVPITSPKGALSGVPSPQAQSWGAVISIIIIVLMIIIGAFYAWGQRISQNQMPTIPSVAQ